MGDLIDPWSVGWTIINFALFVYLLRRLFFKRVIQLLDERREFIATSLKQAEEAQQAAEKIRSEYDGKLAEARREAQEIIERAQAAAEKAHQERMAATQREAEAMLERAQKTIEREREEAIAALRAEVADLAVLAAERIIGSQLSGDEHRRLAEEAIREAGRLQ